MTTVEEKKYTVLCFHGYKQNSASFREKTGGFRKALKKKLKFEFFSAPHFIKEDNPQDNADNSKNGWWFSKQDGSFSSRDVTESAYGFDESVKEIQKVIQEKGPFDGFIGFSQGAAMIHLLVAMKQLNMGFDMPNLKFVIFFSAFKSLSSLHANMTSMKIFKLPTFHVYGLTDEIVISSRSQELASLFDDPKAIVVEHPGKHCIPPVNLFKKKLLNFLNTVNST